MVCSKIIIIGQSVSSEFLTSLASYVIICSRLYLQYWHYFLAMQYLDTAMQLQQIKLITVNFFRW